jgi:hypothetical protein
VKSEKLYLCRLISYKEGMPKASEGLGRPFSITVKKINKR